MHMQMLFFLNRYYAKPLIKIQKIQNLSVALRFITQVEKIFLPQISKCQFVEVLIGINNTLVSNQEGTNGINNTSRGNIYHLSGYT